MWLYDKYSNIKYLKELNCYSKMFYTNNIGISVLETNLEKKM